MDEDKIEQLKKKLYSSTEKLPKMRPVNLREHNISVDKGWKEEQENIEEPKKVVKVYSFLKGLMIFAIIFLIIAFGIAYYYFTVNPNAISNSNIDIKVSGPITISAGQELSLDVDVYNNNSTILQAADLIVTYPEGTRRADDKVTSLITDRIPIGDIAAKGAQRTTIKSILLGEEGSVKNINIALEYKIPESNSLFVKEKSYPMSIGTGPVSITIDSIKEITPEQETKFIISVKSNSSDVIGDVVLKGDYPFGFDYISAKPTPSASTNSWRLGDIAPGETKKIEVDAKIFGQANQERTLRFYTGTASKSDPNQIDTTFASYSQAIALKAPFLGADVSINDSGDEIVVVRSGQFIHGQILWKNNLDVAIHDIAIEAKLSGSMADRKTVNVTGGFYKSLEDTIYWDKSNYQELSDVAPNQSGIAGFNMKIFDLTKNLGSNIRRPEVTLNFTVKGNRLNENKVPEDVKSSASRVIRIASDILLKTSLLYTDGPFENSGPVPPVVDNKTTYTVNIKVFNSYNTVKNAVYTAKLPIYVEWLGKVNPSTASSTVIYSPENRTVTWNMGDVSAGSGFSSVPKEMSFQVGFVPSITQEYQTPVIVTDQRIAGTDSFTNTVVDYNDNVLNTDIKNDSKYILDWGKVVGK